jgi:hypothetical protein
MASRSALWVLGVARLISSASTTWANTGPFWNSKRRLPEASTIMLVPVTSDGIRSGVNCTRAKDRSSVSASVRTSRVLPSPGTPFEQHVAPRQQRRHHPLDDRLVPDDAVADLLHQRRHVGAELIGGGRRRLSGHGAPPLRAGG